MSLYLDTKYLMLLSINLRNFKKVSENVYHASCEICGDSKKDATKARGYFYLVNNHLNYKCHNCGVCMSFSHYLKSTNPNLYNQYVFEKLRAERLEQEIEQAKKEKMTMDTLRSKKTIATSELVVDGVLDNAVRLDRLPDDHPCKQYIIGRKLPEYTHTLLYYVEDFKKYVNQLIPGKFKTGHHTIIENESRLLIPYFDRHGRVFAFQGRSLDPECPIRYFTIKLDEDKSPIYGLERVDYSKPVYISEGPIDSLCLPNCIAVSGACYSDPLVEQLKTNATIIPDNERRNKEVTKQVEKMINSGYKVCLWPDGLEFKDINEAIQKGYTSQQLLGIINENTYSGLTGKVKFKTWTR